jgi:hypothetical protein
MKVIKQYGYLILNILLACGTMYFFFTGVLGFGDRLEKKEEGLTRHERQLRSLSRQKPDPSWYEGVDENLAALELEKQSVLERLVLADERIEKYYDLDSREQLTDLLPTGRYAEFKEMLQEKWNHLRRGDDLTLKWDKKMLLSLEPKWLRSSQTPSRGIDVEEAMKRYWIVKELLGLMDATGAVDLLELNCTKPSESLSHQVVGKPFWFYRDLMVTVVLPSGLVRETLESVHDSEFLFRTVGYKIENQKSRLPDVVTDADFLSFDNNHLVKLSLGLRHYDLVRDDGDIADFKTYASGVALPSGSKSGRRSRRGR